jgi:hypothetical protein
MTHFFVPPYCCRAVSTLSVSAPLFPIRLCLVLPLFTAMPADPSQLPHQTYLPAGQQAKSACAFGFALLVGALASTPF